MTKEETPSGLIAQFVASLEDRLLESQNHTEALVRWIRKRIPNPEKAKSVQLDRIVELSPPSLSSFIRCLFDEKARRKERGKKGRKR